MDISELEIYAIVYILKEMLSIPYLFIIREGSITTMGW